MIQTTLLLLVKGNPVQRVLLGYKKTGFGKGKYTGIGGKVEPGETILDATVREMHEETGVRVSLKELLDVGHIAFYFPARPDWNLTVHVFLAHSWHGTPEEGREVRPEWFDIHALPFHTMWDDASYWYPRVLSGEKVDAVCTFHPDNETVATFTLNS